MPRSPNRPPVRLSHPTAPRTHELPDLRARTSGSERIGDGTIITASGNGYVGIGENSLSENRLSVVVRRRTNDTSGRSALAGPVAS